MISSWVLVKTHIIPRARKSILDRPSGLGLEESELPKVIHESSDLLTPGQIRILRRKLLDWYASARRDLPWRRALDPYPVWISEVMLQQTQVETVIPYYRKFLAAYPDIRSLAESETRELLRLWAGLGYYSRAKNLQKAAQIICQKFGGRFPRNHTEVLALPGIGPYTAAAILSIAFGEPLAVVDGNVKRVLARLLKIRGDLERASHRHLLWHTAQQILPVDKPGDFNQGIMELGATVCMPRNPHCDLCPWRQVCRSYLEGTQALFPEKRRKLPPKRAWRIAAVIVQRGRCLLVRRTGQTLLDGFWEFPTLDLSRAGDVRRSSLALVRFVRSEYGLAVNNVSPLITIKHSITSHRIVLQVFQAEVPGPFPIRASRPNCRWVPISRAHLLPMPSASLKVLEEITIRKQQ